MDRRGFVGGLGLLPMAPCAVEAQPTKQVRRLGVLIGGSDTPPGFADFREALRELGYTEGDNLRLELRFAQGKADRLAELAADLVRSKVDIIVAVFVTPARAAHHATRSIPIVMISAGDPVGVGLAASLARPGGNVTGTASYLPELGGKPLQLFKELLPDLKRLAVLWNPSNPAHVPYLKDAESAARSLAIQLQPLPVAKPEDLEGALRNSVRDAAAVWVLGDALFFDRRAHIAAFLADARRPALFAVRAHVEAGGLLSYGPHGPTMFRRAATHVDKILKGAKPGELPIEQPTVFELAINLKTAKTLGLTIPRSLLLQATHVVQ